METVTESIAENTNDETMDATPPVSVYEVDNVTRGSHVFICDKTTTLELSKETISIKNFYRKPDANSVYKSQSMVFYRPTVTTLHLLNLNSSSPIDLYIQSIEEEQTPFVTITGCKYYVCAMSVSLTNNVFSFYQHRYQSDAKHERNAISDQRTLARVRIQCQRLQWMGS